MKTQQKPIDMSAVIESLRRRCIGPLHQARFTKRKAGADLLEKKTKLGSKDKFLGVMANVPDVEPEEYDKL